MWRRDRRFRLTQTLTTRASLNPVKLRDKSGCAVDRRERVHVIWKKVATPVATALSVKTGFGFWFLLPRHCGASSRVARRRAACMFALRLGEFSPGASVFCLAVLVLCIHRVPHISTDACCPISLSRLEKNGVYTSFSSIAAITVISRLLLCNRRKSPGPQMWVPSAANRRNESSLTGWGTYSRILYIPWDGHLHEHLQLCFFVLSSAAW